jgi:hypothetical protein
MLAPLGLYLLAMLIMCAMVLLICWAYDSYRAEIEAGPSRRGDLKFPAQPHARKFNVAFPAPRLPEQGGISGRLDRGSTPRTPARWRLERGAGVVSRFRVLPNCE